jgi:hypothetical protein
MVNDRVTVAFPEETDVMLFRVVPFNALFLAKVPSPESGPHWL